MVDMLLQPWEFGLGVLYIFLRRTFISIYNNYLVTDRKVFAFG